MGLYPPDKAHDGDDVENGDEVQGSLSAFDNSLSCSGGGGGVVVMVVWW